jgi:GH24 family phage-related lysozyme (muramidase)
MSYLDDSMAQLEVFEGIIPWLYVDTRGFVTVGVGEMLASVSRAQSLSFIDGNGQPVSPEAILGEYNRIRGLPSGRTAGFYRSTASPVLAHATIDDLLMKHLQFFDSQLNQKFANYQQFPDPAKLGLLDMIYNLGVMGLFNNYPTFMGFVQKEDWTGAASECHRNGPGQARNDWTKEQFLAAAASS